MEKHSDVNCFQKRHIRKAELTDDIVSYAEEVTSPQRAMGKEKAPSRTAQPGWTPEFPAKHLLVVQA